MDQILNALDRADRQARTRYWGKYRGFVVDATDPEGLARLRLSVPSVLGEATSDWALPCLPYGGASGFGFAMIPPVGAQVVVEFIEGDISSPIWTGTFWRKADEVPPEFAAGGSGMVQEVKGIKTESGHLLTLDDTQGTEVLTLASALGASLAMDEQGSLILTDKAGSVVRLDAQASEIAIEDANGNSIVLNSTGITCTDASGNTITASGAGVEVKTSATITLTGSMVAVAGAGGEPLIKGATFLSLFNTHIHGTTAPGAPTTPPVVPLTPAVLTTKSTAQ